MHTHPIGRGTYQGPQEDCPWCDDISRLGQPGAAQAVMGNPISPTPQLVEAPAPAAPVTAEGGDV